MTLSNGQQFSLGFKTLHKEDSSTLLESCMGLLNELAEIYDDEQSEKILKKIFLKFGSVMADRCSVNKKFGAMLNEVSYMDFKHGLRLQLGTFEPPVQIYWFLLRKKMIYVKSLTVCLFPFLLSIPNTNWRCSGANLRRKN